MIFKSGFRPTDIYKKAPMIYKFSQNAVAFEFSKNRGRAILQGTSSATALSTVRDLFRYTRDESVSDMGGNRYQVDFKVALDYHLPMVRSIEKTVRLISSPAIYKRARYTDQYVVASIARETGKPGWVPASNLKEEISALRKAAVVAGEVARVAQFLDWDICIHNYIELNSKEGFRSRVMRKPDSTSDPEESMVDVE